jgi:hypothetical protein
MMCDYTHRVVMSNHRLVKMKDGQVSFRWKDYAHGQVEKVMTLEAFEFIRSRRWWAGGECRWRASCIVARQPLVAWLARGQLGDAHRGPEAWNARRGARAVGPPFRQFQVGDRACCQATDVATMA